ncbi:choice-of-anchor D domain-containing protein [Archangium lansingense]|uniref:Choice-of-anchor D domain-containing protein n=1 Tax=Archangium lansingense TaxID=2995310 RepID=A0ABT4AAJ5_9BACT|nr:choice-of-anchor D domain-containing protein [Archangium lansinium]MCY1078690.1 choice-of-anchor D domain-containing protein [Archangium lansinium]
MPRALTPGVVASSLTWSREELIFAPQDSCTSRTEPVTLFNGTGASRTIYFASIQSPFTIKEIKNGTTVVQLPVTLPANESLTFTLELTPRDFGPVQGSLLLFSDDPILPNPTVSLSGAGTGAFFKVDVTSLAFGSQTLGSSTFRDVRVSNTGDAPLTFSGRAPALPFSVQLASTSGPLPAEIVVDAQSFKDLRVSFQPTSSGSFQANLPLQRSLPCSQMFVISLAGTAQTAPVLTATPATLDFGPQRVGVDSPERQVTIRNVSTSSLTLNHSSISPNFTVVSSTPTLPRLVSPNEDVVIKVKFSPVNDIASSGALTLSASGQGTNFEVPLLGAGTRPLITFEPSALDLGSQRAGTASTAMNVTVRNGRAFEMKGLTASVSGPFLISPSSFNLPANGTFPLQVVFSPLASNSGQMLGSVTVSGMSSEPVFSLPLQGTAVRTQLTLNPGTVDFGDVVVGTTASRQFTLTNPSPLDVTLHDVPVQPPFSIVLPQTPAGMVIPANGGHLALEVRFTPDARQSSQQSVNVSSNSTSPSPVLALSGKGVAPMLTLSVTSLDFRNKIVGGEYSSPVTVTNSGDSEVKLSTSVESPFRVQGLPPSTRLASQGSVTIQVVFAPTSLASVEKSLRFLDEDNVEMARMQLTGSANGPVPIFSPELELDLGSVQVAKACSKTDTSFNPNKPQPVSISNSSSATNPLKIQGIATNPPFSVILPSGTPFPTPGSTLNLQPGEVLLLDVCFVPTQETPANSEEEGGLRISYEGNTSDKVIKLVGRGAMASLTLDRTAVDFGAVPLGGFREVPLTLRNPGELPVRLTEVISTNPLFSFRDVSWPKELDPLDEVYFFASFLPVTDGNFSASLQIKTENAGTLTLPMVGTGASAKAALSLSSHNFGSLQVGNTSTPISVYISNVGTAPLLFNGATTTTGDFTFETELPNAGWPVQIDPQAQHELKVFFKPRRAGVLSGTLSLTSNAQAAPLQVSLQGTGLGLVEILPASLDFGSANVGDPAREGLVTIVNSTVDPVNITGITTSNPDEFAVVPTPFPSKVLQANEFLAIPLHFKPKHLGQRSATLNIPMGVSSRQVALTGVGTSPELELLPSGVMDFGGVKINTPSAADAGILTLINRGSSASGSDAGYPGVITLSKLELSGADSANFELGQLPLPQELQPGAQLQVPVTFRPTQQGALTASLFLTTGPLSGADGGVGGHARTVSLTGMGLSSVLELSNRELNFGMQVGGRTSEPKSFTITNKGGRAITLVMDVEGEQFSHFTMQVTDARTGAPKNPPYLLEGGSTAKVSVRFTPLAGVSSDAQVRIRSNDGDDDSVPLKGLGMFSDLEADVENLEVDFGTVLAPSDPKNVSRFLTITNTTTQDVTLNAPVLEGPAPSHFELLEQWTAGTVLSANQRATLKLGYRAQEATNSEATLVVSTTKSTSDQALRVSLTGRAVTNFLSVTPMDLDFGFVDIGGQSDPTEITLTNEARVDRLVRVESANPAFEVEASELTSPLEPGESATLRVTFHPTEGGTSSGELRLRLQGEDSADIVIKLRGQGRTLEIEGGACSCGAGGGNALLGLLGLVALRGRPRPRVRGDEPGTKRVPNPANVPERR